MTVTTKRYGDIPAGIFPYTVKNGMYEVNINGNVYIMSQKEFDKISVSTHK